jgi:hypothetical protein
MFKRFLQGPRGHRRHEIGAAGENGFGAPYHQAFEYRPLPGAGAGQWAWETLALPMYTPIGAGTRNKRQFAANEGGIYVAVQGITITPLGGSPIGGDLTGQFTTQPLLDVQQAEASGIQTPAYASPANINEMPVMSIA